MDRLKGEPFVLLGINSDSDREELKTTLEEERINWRSWWDDGGIFGPIQTKWAVANRPTIHLLDWNGIIRQMMPTNKTSIVLLVLQPKRPSRVLFDQ